MGRFKELLSGLSDAVEGFEQVGSAIGRLNRTLQKSSRGEMVAIPSEAMVPKSQSGLVAREYNVKTIDERVSFIITMIQKGRDDPNVRAFAVKSVSKRCGERWCTKEGDYDNEVRAVFDELRSRYRYVRDTYGKDLFQHPARTLEMGGGDCDDATILICSTLGAIGYPTKCRVIRTKEASDWNHIYALVGLPPKGPNRWVPLDLSVSHKPPGWEPPQSMIAAIRDFDVPLKF